MNDKYTLTIGIHRGTITSRDTEQPKELPSRQECINELSAARKFYASLGYVIWFASVLHPDGRTETLEGNSNYR